MGILSATRLRRARLGAGWSVLVAAVFTACSDPEIPDGAFACGAVSPECPPDFVCADDGRCHREPDPFAGGAGGEGIGGFGGEGGGEPECGDAICDPPAGEDCVSCETDCGPCAATCGDGDCIEETCVDCPDDCGVCPPNCGDGTCDVDETPDNCPADC